MALLQSCCCWRSVRRGSYASAVYTMCYFLVSMLVVGLFANSTRSTGTTASLLQPDSASAAQSAYMLVVLACSTGGLLSSWLLLIGLRLDNRTLLIPWMFVIVLTALVDVGGSLYLITFEKVDFKPDTAMLFTVDFFLLSLNMYSLLCVVSQYQEYKAGRGRAVDEDNVRRLPPVRYLAQPTATSILSTRRGTHTTVHDAHSPTADCLDATGPSLMVPPPAYSRRPASVRKHVKFPDQSSTQVVLDEDSSPGDSPCAGPCSSLEDASAALNAEWPPDEQALLMPVKASTAQVV